MNSGVIGIIPPRWQPGRDAKRTFRSPLLYQSGLQSVEPKMLKPGSNLSGGLWWSILSATGIEISVDILVPKTDGSTPISNAVHRQLA